MKVSNLFAGLLLFTAAIGVAAAPAVAGTTLKGEVLEARDVAPYTYLRLKTADGEIWAAVDKVSVKPGTQITIDRPLVMQNFESKALKKTFDKIVFGTIADANAPSAAALMPRAGPAGHTGAAVPTVAVKVAKASGADALTVAEVVLGKDKLKDKRVSLRGQVVKSTSGIMGKNWFHLQDGSGTAGAGTNDILVTSTDAAAVGDVVNVKGTVRTAVKLGGGYDYAVLIEGTVVRK